MSAGRAVALACLFGLALRALRLALDFPLFGDEAFLACSVLFRDLAELRGHLEYDMVAPLGYLVLAKGSVSLLGASEVALRLPAFLAGCGALVVLAVFARRRLEPRVALLATLVLAVAYYAIRHTGEAKPYALDLLASAALLAAWTPTGDRAEPPLHAVPRLALTVALVWLSYPAVFAAGAVLLARLFARDDRSARARTSEFLLAGGLLGWSFFFHYHLHAAHQQWGAVDFEGHAAQWADDFPPLDAPLSLPVWLLHQHTGLMLAIPAGGTGHGSVLSLLLVAFGLATARGGPWPTLRRQLLFAMGLTLAAACFQHYPYGGSARAALHLFPWFALFLTVGVARLVGPRGGRVAVALLVLFGAWLGVRDVVKPYRNAPDLALRAEIRAVAADLGPDEEVALYGRLRSRVPGALIRDTWSPPAWHRGPDLWQWRSGSARLRAYVAIATGRPPTTSRKSSRAPCVLAFEDPEDAVFPTATWEAYVADRAATVHTVDLGGDQTLHVLRD